MKIILSVFIIAFLNASYAQDGFEAKVRYIVSFQNDSIDILKLIEKHKETQKALSDFYRDAKDVEANLSIKNHESIYKVNDTTAIFSYQPLNITKIFAGNKNTYYSNSETDENITQSDATNQWYLISYPKNEWMITEEKKTINDYECFRAILISEPKTIVWFTKDIPIQFGPMNYHGLPGLIVEMQKSNFLFSLKSINMEPENPIVISKPTNGTPITAEDYMKKFGGIFKQ